VRALVRRQQRRRLGALRTVGQQRLEVGHRDRAVAVGIQHAEGGAA
jgi:hypothetical protein